MSENSQKVFPLKRIAAAVYDLLLLLGVWFASGSIAVWINGGIIESKWIGPLIVFLSTWIFYGYFWTHGGKTLGMAVWKFEIYSLDKKPLTFYQISISILLEGDENRLWTIFHEVGHVLDLYYGHLTQFPLTWKGKPVPNNLPWRDRPWEKSADVWAYRIWNRLVDAPSPVNPHLNFIDSIPKKKPSCLKH